MRGGEGVAAAIPLPSEITVDLVVDGNVGREDDFVAGSLPTERSGTAVFASTDDDVGWRQGRADGCASARNGIDVRRDVGSVRHVPEQSRDVEARRHGTRRDAVAIRPDGGISRVTGDQ